MRGKKKQLTAMTLMGIRSVPPICLDFTAHHPAGTSATCSCLESLSVSPCHDAARSRDHRHVHGNAELSFLGSQQEPCAESRLLLPLTGDFSCKPGARPAGLSYCLKFSGVSVILSTSLCMHACICVVYVITHGK